MAYPKLTQHSLTNDMSKQGFVPQGRVAAPGVNSQQSMFPPTQNLRGQPPSYFPNATQNVQTPRTYPLTSTRPSIPLIYGLTGQTTGQAYTASPGTQVIMNPNPVMTYPSAGQRIQTPPFTNQPQQSVQQFQMAAAAASPQFYPPTPPATNPMFYPQTQSFPVSPQRPPSAPAVQNTQSYQRRQRSLIQIVDPNTGKDISDEIFNNRSAVDGSLQQLITVANSIEFGGSQMTSDMRAQFAAQVAATLKPGPQNQLRDPMCLQYPLSMQQVQSVPVQQQQQPQQQQVQLTQQIQSHPAVAQAPQVPHTQTQVHQVASVQQPAQPPPPQPGLAQAPISHISPRPVTPQSQPPPQPQRRQPSKSPPSVIGNIPGPVQNLKDTGCMVFQAGASQNQELMATQSHTLSSPHSLQESPLSIQTSSAPVQNKTPPQVAPSPTPPGASQASQVATAQAVPPPPPTQIAQQVVASQPTQPVAAQQPSQPSTMQQTLPQVTPVAPQQPLQQVVPQPPPQLAPPQPIVPVTPAAPQQPSQQVSQTSPVQIPQAPLQQPPSQQPLLPASQQQTTPQTSVSNETQPTQVTQHAQKKQSLSPPVEIATESTGHSEVVLLPTGSKPVANVEKNNTDAKVQQTSDLKKEISPPPSSPPTSQTSMFEKSADNKLERHSPKNIKLENENEQKPVTDDKESARVPSPLENSKVNEDYTAKDLKKDKPKKKKEEITKKGKSKEELETETPKDPEPSVQEPKEQEREEQCPSPNDAVKVVETKEEKPVEDEEDITKVEIKIEDKIVANENEKNEAKNNEEDEENIDEGEDTILKYRYKEDQWSPLNPEGKKQYDRDFLLELQFSNESLSKPSGLPDLPDVILMKPHTQEMTRAYEKTGIQTTYDFTPGYVKSSKGPSSSGGGGSMTKRGSQQGSGRKEIKKIPNMSIPTDVPLNRCENAWKPSYKVSKETEDEEINRKVRSILNKLTPQKFQVLLTQIREIQIDTENKLKVVIDLLFEKAISEPSFSVAYANLCRYLTLLRVPSATKPGEIVNFRGVLLTRCQKEFEKDTAEEATLGKKRLEIENAKSEEKKKKLTEELEEEFSAAKRRSIGNIRFIGELFKLKMLTENIMHECVFKLLRSKDEENLECLCRLLKTIGKELDSDVAKPRMDQYFHQMKKIVSEKKTSSRVRFMLQDVMELRECKWIPRHAENNPKTIEQIHAEAAQEEKEKKIMLEHAAAMQRSSHHRSGGNGGGSAGNRGNQGQRGSMGGAVGGDDGGWNTVSSKQIRPPLDLMKFRLPKQKIDNNVQLGPGGGNLSWARGSSGGLKGSQESERPGNRFSALSGPTEEGRGRVYGRGGVSPARGEVISRSSLQSSSASNSSRGKMPSRSSQEGDKDKERVLGPSRNVHSSSGRATPPSRGPSRESSRSRDVRPSKEEVVEPQVPAVKELSEAEIKNKTKAIMDEYLHLTDIQEATQCVIEIKNQPLLHNFVSKALEYVLERSAVSRRQTAQLLHNLVKAKIIDVEVYLKGLNEILEFAEDMEIDIPMIWKYLGELIGHMVQDECLPINFLKDACEPLIASDKAKILIAEILFDASHEMGHRKVGEIWRSSGLQWSDFMNKDDVDSFIKEKKLEFTLSDDAPQPNPEKISIAKINEELNSLLLTPKAKNEEIFDWIDANVPEEMTKQSPFIRALMTAVCSSAISGLDSTARVEEQLIKERCKLLQKYLCNQTLQLQALYALQALDHKLEHPQSVLRSIFNFLFDEEVISEEAFNKWEKSDDPAEQEGKGVALKQVVQFFTWLQNYNEDS